MSRRTDHCLRCGYLGRRRSYERVYRCRECQHIRDAVAQIRKARRMNEGIDIIGDSPTISRLRINALDRQWFLPSARSENSSFTLVAPTEAFGFVARNYGINTTMVDFFDDRTTVLRQELDSLSGNNLTVILFPGTSLAAAIEEYMERSQEPVIVLADVHNERYWQELGVLTISADELPKQR